MIFSEVSYTSLTKHDINKNWNANIRLSDRSVYSLNKQTGLTLLEMLVAIAIVIIVLTVVAPNVQQVVKANRITAEINELSGVIQFARFTAIDQNANAVVCPASDFSNCGTNWNSAKIVFIDNNSNNIRDTSEPLLMTTGEITSTNQITGPGGSVIFRDSGATNLATNIQICPNDNDEKLAKGLSLNAQGRVKINTDSDNDGVVEDIEGNALSCS